MAASTANSGCYSHDGGSRVRHSAFQRFAHLSRFCLLLFSSGSNLHYCSRVVMLTGALADDAFDCCSNWSAFYSRFQAVTVSMRSTTVERVEAQCLTPYHTADWTLQRRPQRSTLIVSAGGRPPGR